MYRIYSTPKLKGYKDNMQQIKNVLIKLKDLEVETLQQHFIFIDTDGKRTKNKYHQGQLLIFNTTSPNNNIYFIIHQLETQTAADLLYKAMMKESQLLNMNKIYKI